MLTLSATDALCKVQCLFITTSGQRHTVDVISEFRELTRDMLTSQELSLFRAITSELDPHQIFGRHGLPLNMAFAFTTAQVKGLHLHSAVIDSDIRLVSGALYQCFSALGPSPQVQFSKPFDLLQTRSWHLHSDTYVQRFKEDFEARCNKEVPLEYIIYLNDVSPSAGLCTVSFPISTITCVFLSASQLPSLSLSLSLSLFV